MRFLSRLTNLWKLSAYEPGQPQDEYKEPGTQLSMIVKKPEKQKAQFIPRIKEKPIDKINSIANEV